MLAARAADSDNRPSMAQSDDPHAADVFDFVDAYAAAQEKGEDPPLAHWLARFPASQAAIANEWLALRRTDPSPSSGGARSTPIVGPDRIGPYRLIRELGRGGQGTVFLAEDTRILRRVALKVLASRFDTIRDDKLRRFRREAEIIARLEHPSLCTVYEADLEGEQPYLAMRFVEGRTLAEVLTDARKSEEGSGRVQLDVGDETSPRAVEARFPPTSKLELDQVLYFFERSARALHAAHEAGVVHRDVKPGNVIVSADGKPVILDFGLARDEQETDASQITESGEIYGTPAYMSPEQLELASDQLDRRTDVYSLGVALYESLTLRRPFEQAARPALYVAIQSEAPPDVRSFNASLPEDVAVVLETALEKDRTRRYATALDLAEDLRRIRQYEPIRARPAGVGVRFARWGRRHPALAAATIGTIVSLSAGLAVALNLLAAERRAVSEKDVALGEKDAALSVALGKHLAQRSIALVSEDASAALAVGILAAERAPGFQTMSALYPALEGCWLERVLAGDDSSQLTTALAVDPVGNHVVVAFSDGVALVWELATGRRVARIAPAHGNVDVLDLDAAGQHAALACADGTITIARLADGVILSQITTGQRMTRLAFSRDGTHLLARAATGAVRVIDVPNRTVVAERASPHLDARWLHDGRVLLFGITGFVAVDARLEGPGEFLGGPEANLAVDVAPDGSRFARALDTGEIEVRNLDFEVLTRFHASTEPIRNLAIAPHSGRLAWSADTGTAATLSICEIGGSPIRAAISRSANAARLEWSPDGERVAVVTGDTIVRVFDGRSGEQQQAFSLRNRQLDAAWTPDGSRLVTAVSGFAYVWFARERPDSFDLAQHVGGVHQLRIAGDGDRVLAASDDGTASIASITKMRVIHRLGPVHPRENKLIDARFAAEDAFAITATEDGLVHVFDGATGFQLGSARFETGIRSIATHAATKRVVVVSPTGDAYSWNLDAPRSAAERIPASSDGARTTCAAYLMDGASIALGSSDGRVEVRDARTLTTVHSMHFTTSEARGSEIVALAVSPRGNELAAGCADRRLRFWVPGQSVESRANVFVFYFGALDWDPNAVRLLARGQQPGTKSVLVVDAATGEKVSPKNFHRGKISCAAFSEDGALALTGASDGSVFVWSTRDGSPLVQRTDLGSGVRSAIFVRRSSGTSVVAGLEDGRIRVFPLDPLAAARARRPRELAEWEVNRERALAAPLPFD